MHFQAIVNSFSGLGPFCFHFNKDEQHTVLTLKQKLEQATSVGVNQQRIRSMAGKLLTDDDLLFDDQLATAEPIILNMNVRLLGGRNNEDKSCLEPSCSPTSQLLLLDQQPLKKTKMNCGERTTSIEKIKVGNQVQVSRRKEEELLKKKGKEKETRKRKNFNA